MGNQLWLTHPKNGAQQPHHFSAHVYCGQTVAHVSNCWALVKTNCLIFNSLKHWLLLSPNYEQASSTLQHRMCRNVLERSADYHAKTVTLSKSLHLSLSHCVSFDSPFSYGEQHVTVSTNQQSMSRCSHDSSICYALSDDRWHWTAVCCCSSVSSQQGQCVIFQYIWVSVLLTLLVVWQERHPACKNHASIILESSLLGTVPVHE